MTKKLIAIPEGNLLRVAATKSVTTLTAIKEKTSVDRKTLRLINAGQPVKETTLQVIADRLRVPLAHLLGSNTVDKREDVSGGDAFGYREIKLQRLDAAALRKLAGETDEITWFLKIDQMSEELEALLLKFGESLHGWFFHILTVEDPGMDDLRTQISHIKTSADIDKCVEELARHNLTISGGTYVAWERKRLRHSVEDYPLPLLSYTSRLKRALSIAPANKSDSIVRVYTGSEPPQKFVESELTDIDFVEIDRVTVWSRETNFSDEAKKHGPISNDIVPF